MKKILYLLFILLPSLLIAQNREASRGADRLKLPKTPRRYYTQKNHQRLLGMDREMRVKRMYLEKSIPELSHSSLPQEVTIPVVVHRFTNRAAIPSIYPLAVKSYTITSFSASKTVNTSASNKRVARPFNLGTS